MPLEFLDAPAGADAAAPETPAEAPVAAQAPEIAAATSPEEPLRGPDGKFIAREPAQAAPAADGPAPDAAATPAALDPAAPPAGYVPVQALQEVRGDLKATKAELDALKRQVAPQPPPSPPAQAPEPPDRYADPEGYEAWRDQQLEFRLFNERCNVSERFARTQFGDELVDEAKAWATRLIQSDPLFNQRLWSQSDPYGFAVAEYRKDTLFSDLKDDDFAAFQAWRAQQGQPPAAPPPIPPTAPTAAAPPKPAPSPPPKSLASAPSAGGPAAVPVGPGQAFDAAFSLKG